MILPVNLVEILVVKLLVVKLKHIIPDIGAIVESLNSFSSARTEAHSDICIAVKPVQPLKQFRFLPGGVKLTRLVVKNNLIASSDVGRDRR